MARDPIADAGARRPMLAASGRVAALAIACALSSLAGCPSRGHDPADTQALARMDAPLAWSLHRAQATTHLVTSSMETRDAAPGYRFVVLDVSVRNRDTQPQVLSEGKLVAVDETNLQTFDQPVTLLSDDYLSLQVLAPDQGLRGKIAYEVPEHLPGVLYWSPGNGSERVLLNVNAPLPPPATLADADQAPATSIAPDTAPVAGSKRGVPTVAIATASDRSARTARADRSGHGANRAPAPRVAIIQTATAQRPPDAMLVLQPVGSDPVRPPTPVAALHQAPIRSVATPASLPAPAPISPPRMVAGTPPVDRDRNRRLACEGLVARDDPAEKAGNLGFFTDACRDYPLPAHWRPQPPRRSLLARATDLLGRVVLRPRVVRLSDCSSGASSQADTLVCADPRLSAMDHQLAQSVARARDEVDDPAALQREQEQWRRRVRNHCDTSGCLAQAYGRRIAQLDALVSRRD